MIHKPYRFRDKDDDCAPMDYSYVSSVSEGRRREQQKNIAREPENAILRHRADPFQRDRVDAYGTHASASSPRRSTVAGRLPTSADGSAPASSIAYPDETEIPENPFDPPAEAERPSRQSRRRAAQPEPVVTDNGSQFDPPAMAQLPEWYRIAQQNSMPRDERRRSPQVQAAPRHEVPEPQERPRDILGRPLQNAPRQEASAQPTDLYEAAGYPPELLYAQREKDEEYNRVQQRRHHGAQTVVNRTRQEEYERSLSSAPHGADRTSYPPSREEYARRRELSQEERNLRASAVARTQDPNRSGTAGRGSAYAAASGGNTLSDTRDGYGANPYAQQLHSPGFASANEDVYGEEEPSRKLSIPWLGIAVFAAAILAVSLWLMELSFSSRTQQVLDQRQQAIAVLKSDHPYDYRALIEREAAKNNLNPAFVAAIVLNESSFRTNAESNVGARGLMQVMSETAGEIGGKLNVSNYDFDMLYDAETNVTFGCYYLGQLSTRFRGDPVLVSAAYHAGATQVQNWLNTSAYSSDGLTLTLDNLTDGPTKQYANRVKRDFAVYKRLYYENAEDDA